MEKTCFVLCENADLYYEVDGVQIYSIYKPVGKFLRIIRYLHHRFNIFNQLKSFWLDNWKRNLDSNSDVILFDSILDDTPLLYINRIVQMPVKFCYRNRIQNAINHSRFSRNPVFVRNNYNVDLWSYSKEDCQKYDLNYYNQFHLLKSDCCIDNGDVLFDLFFVGVDKGRMGILIKLAETCRKYGITYKFVVVPDKSTIRSEESKDFLSHTIPYPEVIRNIKHCKCLVDIVSDINSGITYRCLEAATLKKKLITNFYGIMDEDLLDRNNVFLLNRDNIANLPEFVNSGYKDTSKIIADRSFRNFCCKMFGLEN